MSLRFKPSIVALCVTASIGLAGGSAVAAPTRGNNAFEPIYMCGDGLLVFITPSTGANTGWELDLSGDAAAIPFHVKWYSLRVYDGAHQVEPASPPLFAAEKSYGERVGQGAPLRCTGQHVEPGPDPVTVFLDVDFARL